MADIKHSILSDPYLHEPKGISTATTDEAYIADGGGSGDWKTPYLFGVEDYADSATASSPISLTSGAKTKLTNNGLGANTNLTYQVPGVGNIWDSVNNQFNFVDANLELGDTVDFRFDVEITSSATNDAFSMIGTLGVGSGSAYDLQFDYLQLKNAGAQQWIVVAKVYMGDTVTLNNPMELFIKADSAGDTCVVNGWFVRPMYRKGKWV